MVYAVPRFDIAKVISAAWREQGWENPNSQKERALPAILPDRGLLPVHRREGRPYVCGYELRLRAQRP